MTVRVNHERRLQRNPWPMTDLPSMNTAVLQPCGSWLPLWSLSAGRQNSREPWDGLDVVGAWQMRQTLAVAGRRARIMHSKCIPFKKEGRIQQIWRKMKFNMYTCRLFVVTFVKSLWIYFLWLLLAKHRFLAPVNKFRYKTHSKIRYLRLPALT